ncbi:MAG: ZIP family metal transporter [Candidatus Pacebacteria bacterium]|nr:ZIP family metal transporter [Candidatus Paceibacterota bacterium]MDD5357460.1 ZIP family metal transporter [Candidatus Paceibacterota bacterium]
MIILISFAAFIATLIGGLFAIRFKDKLHLVLGFSAGAVIGVAFFDLMPEAIELGEKFHSLSTITSCVALGFIIYLVLDRTIFLHTHKDDHEGHEHKTTHRGILGAGSLSIHSFLDGVAIGLAFQVSAAIGAVVTIAVLVHDFSDGINTVSLILKNSGEKKNAFQWLLLDAVAPVLGATSTLFFTLPEQALSIVLALFAGFFLYIGASDLIPESHHAHPKFLTTGMTLLGVLVLFIAIHFASI